MMLGATRAGCAEALAQELSESQPQLSAWLTRQVPRMFPKAYRWVAEMEEIADVPRQDTRRQRDMYAGIARLYERLAGGAATESRRTGSRTRGADRILHARREPAQQSQLTDQLAN